MKNTKSTTRNGSGRTKGSFSFVKIPLIELVSKFNGSPTDIVVRRKWAEANGFVGLTAAPVDNSQDKVRVAVTVTATDTPDSPVAIQVDNGSDKV